MGKQGRNVNIAREIPGIISIDFDDFTSMFTIKAEVIQMYIIMLCYYVYMYVCAFHMSDYRL